MKELGKVGIVMLSVYTVIRALLESHVYVNYRVGHKKRGTLLLSMSLPVNVQFSKFFHCHTLWTICNNVIIVCVSTP